MSSNKSFIIKRNGTQEPVYFDKITERINKLINLNETIFLDPILVAQKVVARIYPGITTEELDIESAEVCVNLSTTHPLYANLGGRILVSNLHKKTSNIFSDKMKLITTINKEWLDFVLNNLDELNQIIDYSRDYYYDYFGFKTLEKAYLLKHDNKIIERPQDMLLRTSITLTYNSSANSNNKIDLIKKTYNELSTGRYIHASPTLFNSGTNHMQLSSCFMLDTEVMTDKGIQKIQDIKINDQVITHTNKFQKVLQLHKNDLGERDIYELSVFKTKSIYVTNNHKFLSINKDNDKPTWRRIDELDSTHYIASPNYEGLIKTDNITYENQIIIVSKDLVKLFGIFINSGLIIENNNEIVGISFYSKNFNEICFIIEIIKNIFLETTEENEGYLIYNSLILANFFNYIFDNYLWKNIIKWDLELVDSFLSVISPYNTKFKNEIYHLSRMYGIIESDKNVKNINNSFGSKDTKFLKIMNLTKTNNKPDFVYTLGVEHDHSYNVEGLICENCFLLGTNDSLEDITHTWDSCAKISKWAGGIGLHVSNIRGKNSKINGTGGLSNGIVPFLKVFNEIARWIDQGGKRSGSIAIYLEPHHPDIMDFLELRKNFGSETERTRDLFLALWISDLFMKTVNSDEDWYLMSSDECPNLTDVYGDEYETLYFKYVSENKYKLKIKARKIWMAIIESQIETGMPYMLYKDTINSKNNQKNLGTIKSSNLCAEIVQYSDHNEYSVCNLASIAINKFIIDVDLLGTWIIYTKENCNYCKYAKSYLDNNNIIYEEKNNLEELKMLLNYSSSITFPQIFHNNVHVGGWTELFNYTAKQYDYNELFKTAYLATVNLNNVIDINYYPVPETKRSNMRHRPIGLGIQGLADTLVLLRIPFDSDKAIEFNQKMMETIYLAAITASNDIAITRTYEMNTFTNYINTNNIIIPEYYDAIYKLNSIEINNLYHKLKPHYFEITTKYLGAYSTFEGSLFSEGKFQFDMYSDKIDLLYKDKWNELRTKVIKYGTRNSLLTSLMPTASTSQILGNNECFEFFTNNIYTRKTQAGDFILVNKHLVNDLIKINMWNTDIKDLIIANNGSIQTLNIPLNIKNLYKTIWEIKQSYVLLNAKARAYFVDQTQSMNLFIDIPNHQRLTSCHFSSWKNKLKTGMYYLRSKPATDAVKFTINPSLLNNNNECTNCSA